MEKLPGRRLIAIGLLANLAACTGTSTIRMNSGALYEGRLHSSTTEQLLFQDRNDQWMTARCDRIARISHPGLGFIVAGILPTVFGWRLASVDNSKDESGVAGVGNAFGMVLLIPGIVLLSTGISRYLSSWNAAHYCR